MVSLRKRPHAEVDPPASKPTTKATQSQKSTVTKPAEAPAAVTAIRNNWHFANLTQWIYIFGRVVKISEDIDVETLETECLKPRSQLLLDIGLCFLKYLSSHRGLTPELFDEYTRRQYLQKSPDKNPFGNEATPLSFQDFDIATKLKILNHMTQWIMINSEKLRERMADLNDTDDLSWRIEPYGWDSEDRTYFVLDDNRLYRMTDAPPPPEPAKKKARRPALLGTRSRKRRRGNQSNAVEANDSEANMDDDKQESSDTPTIDDGLGGAKWECIAVTYDELVYFISTIEKTKDDNEKILRDQIKDHLLPILQKQANSHKRKEEMRQRELESLAKMATAKRSSRLAVKHELKKAEDDARLEEQARQEAEAKARKQDILRAKLEKERDVRLRARERRLRERAERRAIHEEELKRLEEPTNGEATRVSSRRLQADIELQKEALNALQDDDDWIFDCVCGVHGQVDDGSHSLACERCNVWLHSKCVNVSQEEAEASDFQFVCSSCKRREMEESRPKTIIKLNIGHQDDKSSEQKDDVAEETSSPFSPSYPQLAKDKDNEASALPTAPQSPTKKFSSLSNENGHSTVLVSRHLNDLSDADKETTSSRPAPETPMGKSGGSVHPYEQLPGSSASQRFMGTPMSRGLPTPSGNNVLPPPGRASMSFEESLHGHIASSPGTPASKDTPSSPLPPAEAGISPLKNSPVIPATHSGLPTIGATSSILPPSVLAPSERELILTPPVKMTEEQRRQSQSFQRLTAAELESGESEVEVDSAPVTAEA